MFGVSPKPKQVFQQVAQSKPCHFTGTRIFFVNSEMARLDSSHVPSPACAIPFSSPRFPGMVFWWLLSHILISVLSHDMTQSHWTSHIWAPASLCHWLALSTSQERADILTPWPTRFSSETWAVPSVMKLREVSVGLAWRYDVEVWQGQWGTSSAYYDALSLKLDSQFWCARILWHSRRICADWQRWVLLLLPGPLES